jgi:glycogen(starch) synthase
VRIVFVSREYPPAEFMGGIGTNTATVARGLARRDHEVLVVSRGNGEAYEDEGVEVARLDHRWLPHHAAERLFANRTIAARARRFRPDVVQAAEWEAEAWWIARFGPAPLVTRLATPTYMLDRLNHGGERDETALVRRLERDQARRSAAVFAPTRAIADEVAAEWELAAVDVIPNPVDVDEVRRLAAGARPPDLPERFLVFFGRMEKRKGIEALGRALPAVLGERPQLHAVFVGRDPGDEDGALMQRFHQAVGPVRDRVHVLGELPRPQALAVVSRSQLAVVPSLWESFGYVCVEAMALGRPVVASRAGGLAEIVEDGVSGRLVPPGDADALAAALAESLDDRDALDRTSAAGRRRAEDFAPAAILDHLESLYERVSERGEARFGAGIYARGYRRYFRPDERGPFHGLYERKRDAVLAHFDGRERLRIADVGGGYGRVAGPLARRHDVTLVDVSPEMLEEARRRYPDLRLVQADAHQLPFEEAEFDAVVALDLLPHLRDLDAGVRELARIVRSGGAVVFDTSNSSPWWVLAYPSYFNWRPRRLLRTMRGAGILPEWQAIVRHHRPDEARAALSRAGLRLERCQPFGPRWSAKWHLWWAAKP